ncbi:hypothetical protein [Ruminococcus bromii]|uniref:hypothetical protein n=1 Tax=Ruminococcus bromii TaxID=40518 RepID=UPI003A8E22A4
MNEYTFNYTATENFTAEEVKDCRKCLWFDLCGTNNLPCTNYSDEEIIAQEVVEDMNERVMAYAEVVHELNDEDNTYSLMYESEVSVVE